MFCTTPLWSSGKQPCSTTTPGNAGAGLLLHIEDKIRFTAMNWTGLAAKAWDPSGGDEAQDDYPYLRKLLEIQAGPALDVGCGTGRLLLRFLRDGFDVDGVDTSPDMLEICRSKAERLGVLPNLYLQPMQGLDLPRRYATIYIPCGSFCLVTDLIQAWEALVRMNAHLEDGGLLVFNLFWPFAEGEPLSPNPLGQAGEWGELWSHPQPDGSIIAQHIMRLKIDRVEQVLLAKRRYQLLVEGQVVEEEIFDSNERWYFKHEMVLMLEKTGFRDIEVKGNWSEADFAEPHSSIVFLARK
jgi:SAM-dependent methyltransferase